MEVFVEPFVGYDGDESSMREVMLAPNAGADPDSGALRGFVALVSGDAVVTRDNHIFSDHTGDGISWFRLANSETSGGVVDEAGLLRAFERGGAKGYILFCCARN